MNVEFILMGHFYFFIYRGWSAAQQNSEGWILQDQHGMKWEKKRDFIATQKQIIILQLQNGQNELFEIPNRLQLVALDSVLRRHGVY